MKPLWYFTIVFPQNENTTPFTSDLNCYITHLTGAGPWGLQGCMGDPLDQVMSQWERAITAYYSIYCNNYKRVKGKPLNKSLTTIHSQTTSLKTIHKFYSLFPFSMSHWFGGHLLPPPFPMCWRQLSSMHQRQLSSMCRRWLLSMCQRRLPSMCQRRLFLLLLTENLHAYKYKCHT